jgi:hypothetical protein
MKAGFKYIRRGDEREWREGLTNPEKSIYFLTYEIRPVLRLKAMPVGIYLNYEKRYSSKVFCKRRRHLWLR